ncbi:hypothetical protein P3H15_51655 [Rhodococcus sp. T2V]|uniref:hypothetical protein n=1 Tax=Rhodococcus sp. T2V TaxID=3034164 RepID=UPI0023E1BFBD|nr:hypothetical protein [Rhodococcus sp. T2V]MDF3313371.1 hypothetical protein [Rhodococcus sp. T2V]
MGPGAGVRAAYRLVRFPIHLVDDVVLPVIFDEDAPVRRAYEMFLLGCDGVGGALPWRRRCSRSPGSSSVPSPSAYHSCTSAR